MRVLLTGCRGYIGCVLTDMLVAKGYSVVGLDTDLFAGCDFGAPETCGIESRALDIRDVKVEDLEGFDAVLHLAALSNDPLSDIDARLTANINYRASVRLARLAKDAGVGRFIFSSSCSVYGATSGGVVAESAAVQPVTLYAKSKALVEQEVSLLADQSFVPTYLRHATAYGASTRLRLDVVLNDLVASAYTNGRILLRSDGSAWRPLVHVEDIAGAFIAVLQAPAAKVHNEVFNIGVQQDNYRVCQLAEIVKDTIPGTRIEYASDAGPDKRSYQVDFGKIAATLPEFRFRWHVRRGVEQLFDAYRRCTLTEADILGARYRRLPHLKRLLANRTLNKRLRWPKVVATHRQQGLALASV